MGGPSQNGSTNGHILDGGPHAAGVLCSDLPAWTTDPPIESITFGWGANEDGQLGLDSMANVLSPKVVEALLGTRLRGREFRRCPLVGGSRNTIAIDKDGQVLSWGWNERGTLGHGHRVNELKPLRLSQLKGVRIVQAAIGGWHALAVSDTGRCFAWGGNEYAQCGVHLQDRDVIAPVPCLPQQTVVQVAAGGMHSCALTAKGEVWWWGEPWGDFSMNVDRRPRQLPGAVGIASISCGAFHNLALTWSGEVLAWGINDFGQLGNGTTLYAMSPSQVVGLEEHPVADIAAGGWHSLAITRAGEVFVWGRGEYGRLGLGDKSGSSRLRPTQVRALQGLHVVQAACGGTHTVVLTNRGRIFIWGRGSFGRLGTGEERDNHSPVEVSLPGGPERWRVIAVAAGGRHTLALALPDNAQDDAGSAAAYAAAAEQQQPLRSVTPTPVVSHTPDVDEYEDGRSEEEREGASEPFGLGEAGEGAAPEEEETRSLRDEQVSVSEAGSTQGSVRGDSQGSLVQGDSPAISRAGSAQPEEDAEDEDEEDDDRQLPETGEYRGLGGADSPSGEAVYRDHISNAQAAHIERAMAAHGLRDAAHDE